MNNYEDIKKQFDEVITYSQGIDEPKTQELFERWYAAKRPFISLFGGLIYEVPQTVSFELDETSRNQRVGSFIETVYDIFDNYALGDFLLTNASDFYSNSLQKDYTMKNQENLTIKKGTKIIKAFKYFEKDEKTLRFLQDAASRLIQENKIEGKLCFSVHPLDYLSSSENTYKWNSCHNLHGDYRAGNLSYMVDSATFVCYLKGEDNVILPNFSPTVKWNSKKWRVLFHCSEEYQDFIFAGRQYPFSTKVGLDKALEEFAKVTERMYHKWSDYYIDRVNNSQEHIEHLDELYLLHERYLIPKTNLIENKSNLHFNDVLCSSVYIKPYYTTRMFQSPEKIEVGGEVKCLWCGENFITDSGTMMCDDCELKHGYEINEIYGLCTNCGRRIELENAYYVGCYDTLCKDCFEEECFICADCGEYCYNSEGHYCSKYDDYICTDCYENQEDD